MRLKTYQLLLNYSLELKNTNKKTNFAPFNENIIKISFVQIHN